MLIIKEESAEEIRQAQLWYEVQRPGLGERFRYELRDCLRFMEEHPHRFALRRPPFRAARLSRFPYVVWYAIEGNDLVVYRVRHVKQRPLKQFEGR